MSLASCPLNRILKTPLNLWQRAYEKKPNNSVRNVFYVSVTIRAHACVRACVRFRRPTKRHQSTPYAQNEPVCQFVGDTGKC